MGIRQRREPSSCTDGINRTAPFRAWRKVFAQRSRQVVVCRDFGAQPGIFERLLSCWPICRVKSQEGQDERLGFLRNIFPVSILELDSGIERLFEELLR